MGRAPCCEKNGLKKGPWTPEEDQKLIEYIQNHGHGSWRTLPKNAGLQRCGKSCRLRWTNYLRPDIKRGRFSFEEEETIIQLHSVLGNKWSAIAARLPGRTDNEIKNYWNTHIRKRLLRMGIDPITHTPRLDLLDISSILNSPLYNLPQMNLSRLLGMQQPIVTPELIKLATSLLSSQQENQNSLIQNLAQFQDPNLYQSFQTNQEIQPSCTTSSVLLGDIDTYLNGANPVQPNNVHHFQQNPCNVTGDINPVQNLWQDNAMASNITEDFHPVSTYTLPENQNNFQLNNICNQNFNYTSVLSTPSSSPTPLNSCSTYIATEDERDSYCSDVLKFEVPDIFDIYEL